MRKFNKILCVFLSILMICSCMGIAVSADEADGIVGTTGTFNVINFNVDGTNVSENEGDDEASILNALYTGAKLNEMKYDIVSLQEDFLYDDYIRMSMTNYENRVGWDNSVIERHQTVHSGSIPLGDGLNIFSTFSLFNEYRIRWNVTSGFDSDGADEVTNNGFLVTTIKLAEDRYLDIYDIHADASDDRTSEKARKSQFEQLANYIKKHSVYDEEKGTYDHAVIVTGDFNESICNEDSTGEAYLISKLLEPAHLNDAWAVGQINEIVEDPADYSAYYTYAKETDMNFEETQAHYDSYERICYADGNGIDLSCDSFGYFQMKDDSDVPLSDRFAAEATFSYEFVEKVIDTTHSHDKENVSQEKDVILLFLEYLASIFRAIGKWFANLGNGLF